MATAIPRGQHGTEGDLQELTPRQLEVAALVAADLTNAEIAQRLTLTAGTVANHVAVIIRKLGVRGRVGVAVWAVEHGLYRSNPAQDG